MKILKDMDIKNKDVIVRVDFNVPIEEGKIIDTKRIDDSLKTIVYLINEGCKVILLSHFGKVKKEEDMIKNTLEPVYNYLSGKLDSKVYFSKHTSGVELTKIVVAMNKGEVLLVENTRFEDLNGKLESSNDIQLAEYWASLADVFVLDAFGSCHREHSSTCGIAKFIPSCVGLLVEEEVNSLNKYLINNSKPFGVVMGGAKIDDKLFIIKSLIDKCDVMVLGGGLANTCLKVLGYDMKSSLCSNEEEVLNEVRNILNNYKDKIVLPGDVVVGKIIDPTYVKMTTVDSLLEDEAIYDFGMKSVDVVKSRIANCNTLFINGTLGMYENNMFANGTKELLNYLVDKNVVKVAGGGDAVGAINSLGYSDSFTYLSTGGGATLKFIANGSLVALDRIEEYNANFC